MIGALDVIADLAHRAASAPEPTRSHVIAEAEATIGAALRKRSITATEAEALHLELARMTSRGAG